jgi:hypothetical protein
VTQVVIDPADRQEILYGVVTRDGALVGSFYCLDLVRQQDWRIVTGDGEHLTINGVPAHPRSCGDAVVVLATILAGPREEVSRRLREATQPQR